MEHKPKILIVHNYYQIPGGEDTVVANEKKMLEDNGHQVLLYSRDNSEIKSFSFLRKLMLPITTIFNPRTYRDIRKIIREEDVDIVHVHNTLNLISPAVYYAARSMKTPVVQTVHNFRLLCPAATFYRDGHTCEDCVKYGLKCAVKHNCYRGSRLQTLACVINTKIHRATGIYGKINYICLTEFNKNKLLQLKQIQAEKVFVKPNFVVSTGEIVPHEDRKNQYIFAGRLDKLKGIDVLFEAWKKMGEDAPRLVVCGTGPMDEWCHQFIEQNYLHMIEMKGLVSNQETRKLIGESKALILPTKWYEGFPMSIVEAYSVGTPVIASDLGNAGNIVEFGETGYKFLQNSVDELVMAIKHSGTENIYSNVYKKFCTMYTEQSNYELMKDIYNCL